MTITTPPLFYVLFYKGTTTERTGLTPPLGSHFWDTDTVSEWVYDGSAWEELGSGAGGGVSSLDGGGGPLTGDVTLSEGTGIALTQVGQDIEIAATGGATLDQQGSGSPVGSVTPTAVGYRYTDTASGGVWLAIGATNADWINLGGQTDLTVPGIWTSPNTVFVLGDSGEAALTDVAAQAGTENGIYFNSGAGDGSQTASVILGSSGQYQWFFASDGSVSLPGQVATKPPASSASTLALGTAYQNTLGYDILLAVNVNITVNAAGSVLLGVGPTSTPTQQTIESGITALGPLMIPIYLPNNYYALLSASGLTASIVGQIAMPV